MVATAPACQWMSRPRRVLGMTLLEMLLVLVLIAAAGLLAAGALGGGMRGMQLRTASAQLAAQLRQARTLAITSGQAQQVVVAPARKQWRGVGGRTGTFPPALAISFSGAGQLQPARDEGAIAFFADGGSSGGRIVLRSGEAGRRIDVAWLTGQVRVSNTEGTPQ